MVADELIARLKTIPGVSGVFDTDPPRTPPAASPALVVHHISLTQTDDVAGTVAGESERWQVSVIGSKVANVRAVARAVKSSLHGWSSDAILWCEFESWPGTFKDDTGFHAPLDFMIQHT